MFGSRCGEWQCMFSHLNIVTTGAACRPISPTSLNFQVVANQLYFDVYVSDFATATRN